MSHSLLTRSFFDLLCGSASASPLSLSSTAFTPPTATANTTSCDVHPILLLFAEGRFVDERCEVWAANLLLTCFIAAVVVIRIWWTCGNLPPSDGQYEPAMGRVIHPRSLADVNDDDDAMEEEEESICDGGARSLCVFSLLFLSTVLGFARGGRGRKKNKKRTALATTTAGTKSPQRVAQQSASNEEDYDDESNSSNVPASSCPCYRAYLSADALSQPATASPPLHLSEENATSSLKLYLLSIWNSLIRKLANFAHACHFTHWLLELCRCVRSQMNSFMHSCQLAWSLVSMPFSSVSAYVALHSCGQQTLRNHLRHRRCSFHSDESAPSAGATAGEGRRGAEEDKWVREMLDMSDDEQDDRLAELEELWNLLEGIERRRRALTGRNLFRQPLPPRSEFRGRRVYVSTGSPSDAHERREISAVVGPSCERAVRMLPAIAAGVPLNFSTDRKERPMLMDRRGRWVPVAVIDEDYEYYNYNTDQVLPVD